MVLFFPMQQELDCVNDSGQILGKIKFDGAKNEHVFEPDNESVVLSDLEEVKIVDRIIGLNTGKYSIPMQDDD